MSDPPVTVRMRSVVFDCPDPVALGSFYAELLDGRLHNDGPMWCEVHHRVL